MSGESTHTLTAEELALARAIRSYQLRMTLRALRAGRYVDAERVVREAIYYDAVSEGSWP